MKNRRNNQRRIFSIDVCVLRVSRTGKLGNSKPCLHCVKKMINMQSQGVKINNIYYTDEDGEIVKTTLRKLYDTTDHISRGNRAKNTLF